ncbi:hypothetical protein OF001_U50110 [Pseudomonas sp. OF001]|nr:hypothetical protein OF001_U50110 [Pseudomonas sp. OF001]
MRLSRLGREQQCGATRLTEPFKQGQTLTGVFDPGGRVDLLFHHKASTGQRRNTSQPLCIGPPAGFL